MVYPLVIDYFKENKPLDEGNIASVIEEAVLEDTYREKELAEEVEDIQNVTKDRKEK